MYSVAATVILYYPDESQLLRNIDSYLPLVEKLYVIDNSAKDHRQVLQTLGEGNQKIDYLPNGYNVGVAAALNQAASLAVKDGYQWLLTMDQDSFFPRGEADLYLSQFTKLFSQDDKIGIVAPSTQKLTTTENIFSFGIQSITSGSLISLDIWKEIGGLESRLFIDEVDYEYACRVELNGFKLVQFHNVYLAHSLGEKRTSGLFGLFFKKQRTIHSPVRLYFIVRNYLYIRHKYKKYFPERFRQRDKQVLTEIKNDLLFSGHFFKAFGKVVRGYIDYKKNNFTAVIN